nr:relaxase/mobilization nuclease domain-containing protein [Actinomadura rayongensis]
MGITLPQGHIWHCTLSLRPEESTLARRLSDAAWAEIARATMKKMGFDYGDQAPCRWLAVHHGQSVRGNEHVHLVVNLVREDGSTARRPHELRKLSELCAEVENTERYGLGKVGGRLGKNRASVGKPDVSRAQIEHSRREGKAEPDQIQLARYVRAALAVARDEAEFVRSLRELGILVRPRYAVGGRNQVVGYSVAFRPKPGQKTIWFGGGRLHRELTLIRLRQDHWPEQKPEQNPETRAAWAGASPGKVLPTGGYNAGTWRQTVAVLSEVRALLITVPVDQPALWALAAREAAGVLSMWSVQVERNRPRTLARAADVLARSAQFAQADADVLSHPGHGHGIGRQSRRKDERFDLRGVAVVISTASAGAGRSGGQIGLLRQIVRLMETINEADRARGQALHVIEQAEATHGRLIELQEHWLSTANGFSSGTGGSPGARPAQVSMVWQPGAEI